MSLGAVFGLALALYLGFQTFGSAGADPLSLLPPALQEAIAIPHRVVSAAGIAGQTSAVPSVRDPSSRYNVVIFGDSLGDGVWAGLYRALRKDGRFNVIRKSRVSTGFVRKDYYDWNVEVRAVVADMRVDIAVVVVGTNDRQTIIENGERYRPFGAKWREIYQARLDNFTATLKGSGARVYWMGLPVMREAAFERDMKRFNGIFADRARANGETFIPTHDLLADEKGIYSAYGLDLTGRKRLLRAEDGIHFTMPGYEILGQTIAAAIITDVDSGVVAAPALAEAAPVAAATSVASANEPVSPASLGLKMQIYDMADGRSGRSDDWRWSGAAR